MKSQKGNLSLFTLFQIDQFPFEIHNFPTQPAESLINDFILRGKL